MPSQLVQVEKAVDGQYLNQLMNTCETEKRQQSRLMQEARCVPCIGLHVRGRVSVSCVPSDVSGQMGNGQRTGGNAIKSSKNGDESMRRAEGTRL